ncbi:MAG: sigma-70 family RNA polymerase sigma factor [Candidatus Eremiobacteraeota bacterium]|nr:sigma-70 family RNA polymerase sigma factor [Candidatus Eremiobacteraeota bacterium]MBV8460146.1 sigma-70 family RNA polymerase sigma factor [Candidatus Eremiobacteraeota bacterium]MBV8597066.1 sigma-70 family RNA polymerase sigma factor [Candidatus Eremiobacteraeota bacterium]MBV8671446.1 sigma-70 family RNA polymerase sigma factor [Candidatus Eremiobacteraeota bacterium]
MIGHDSDIEEAARLFALTRAPRARELVCELALPQVRRLASSVLRRLPPHFTDEDLIGDGCVGLLRAIDRFDPERGMSFVKWASRLIRGSMLNGLRRMDSIPERVRRDARVLDKARWCVAQNAGTTPSDAAAACHAGLSRSKLATVQLALRRAVPLSLEAPARQHLENPVMLRDRLAADDDDPGTTVVTKAAHTALSNAVRRLPKRERMIVAAFYGKEASFRTIGGRLGISKQRVSQIHGQALTALRTLLAAPPLDA